MQITVSLPIKIAIAIPICPASGQTTAIETIGCWSGLVLRSHLLQAQGAFNDVYNTGDNLNQT